MPSPGPRPSRSNWPPGDYITYPGDAPHVFEALAPGTSAIYLMEHI
ncbi:hypothetical protein LUW76_04410 [Actinomadura madurae]|nr:hypothetical protein [Actinomadura madurae]URN01900.1 hypothetical protein LUW76_04410 [Actinomadura madurae]